MHYKNGIAGYRLIILIMALLGGCRRGGDDMKTRAELNNGLNTLGTTATTIAGSYTSLVDATNLTGGALVALGHIAGAKGASVQVPVVYRKGRGTLAGLQFDIQIPTGLTFTNVILGPAGTAAGKSISSNPVAGGIRILIFGLNQTVIGDGILATITFGIASTATVGPKSIGVIGAVGSNGAGINSAISASTGTVVVQ